jgi:hypothetical protein
MVFTLIAVIGFLAILPGISPAASEVNLSGVVNDEAQLVADDGTVYEIDEGEQGDMLVELVGRAVNVTGTLKEEGGMQFISPSSFRVIDQ